MTLPASADFFTLPNSEGEEYELSHTGKEDSFALRILSSTFQINGLEWLYT